MAGVFAFERLDDRIHVAPDFLTFITPHDNPQITITREHAGVSRQILHSLGPNLALAARKYLKLNGRHKCDMTMTLRSFDFQSLNRLQSVMRLARA